MEVNFHNVGAFQYVTLEDFYLPKELEAVLSELDALKGFAGDPEFALADEGKKVGSGIFVDNFYAGNRQASAILKAGRKIFTNEFVDMLVLQNAFYEHIRWSNQDYTLVNFYESGGEYRPHKDRSIFSTVCTLSLNSFEGGAFVFPDYNIELPFTQNQLILFPSCIRHGCKKVSSKTGTRASIANFIGYHENF